MKGFLESKKPMITLTIIFSIALSVFNVFDIGDYKSEEVSALSQIQTDTININKADVEELTTLPNIGEETAKRIIEYRKENGEFKTAEELKNVLGISERIFLELCALITVE